MVSSDTNRSSSAESAHLGDHIYNLESLNWKGKLTVSVAVVCGVAAVSYVGVRYVQRLRGGRKKSLDGGKSDENSLAYDVVAKGFATVQANLGPWSFQDLTLGLAALSKMTEKGPPHPPGQPASERAEDANFLAQAQYWRSIAEAAYTSHPASFSLYSQLPESVIVAAEWNPCQETLRPAYVVCIDAPHGAVVLAVRGTTQVVDLLVNSGFSAEPFLGGQAHGGFANATKNLVDQVLPHIKRAFEDQSKCQKDLKLVVTGHSMGAAVGIMAGLKLKQSSEFPNIECWGFSPPACVTLEVARDCQDFVTSFVALHDVVPRFSLAAVELLRLRIRDFDWDEADKIAQGDDEWNNIRSAAEKLKSAQDAFQEAGDGIIKEIQSLRDKIGWGNNTEHEEEKDEAKIEAEMEEEIQKHPQFFVPGRLLILAADPPGSGKTPENRRNVPRSRDSGTYPTFEEAKKVTWLLNEADQVDLKEIVVSPWCVSDHMLGNLSEGIGYFQRHCKPAYAGPPSA